MKEFIEKLIGRLEEESYTIYLDGYIASTEKKIVEFADLQKIVNQLAEEYKHCIKSSCSNCEVYNKKKHYCPKWCEVIKGTVTEIEENRWIACSERLPEKGKAVLTCTKDGWISVNINMSYNGKKNDFECGYYTAWMPLPQAYKPKGE